MVKHVYEREGLDFKSIVPAGKTAGELIDDVKRGGNGMTTTSVENEVGYYLRNEDDQEGHKFLFNTVRQFEFDQHIQLQSVLVDLKELKINGVTDRTTDETTTNEKKKNIALFTKGSFERVAARCNPATLPDDYETVTRDLSSEGFYVLGLACKRMDLTDSEGNTTDVHKLPRDHLEQDLTFLGLLLFKNELKQDSKQAIEELKKGGILPVMITGDNVWTGTKIAEQCGIIDVTGSKSEFTNAKDIKDPLLGKQASEPLIVTIDCEIDPDKTKEKKLVFETRKAGCSSNSDLAGEVGDMNKKIDIVISSKEEEHQETTHTGKHIKVKPNSTDSNSPSKCLSTTLNPSNLTKLQSTPKAKHHDSPTLHKVSPEKVHRFTSRDARGSYFSESVLTRDEGLSDVLCRQGSRTSHSTNARNSHTLNLPQNMSGKQFLDKNNITLTSCPEGLVLDCGDGDHINRANDGGKPQLASFSFGFNEKSDGDSRNELLTEDEYVIEALYELAVASLANPQSDSSGGVVFALTQKAFDYLLELEKKQDGDMMSDAELKQGSLLSLIFPKTVVFGRMTPAGKIQVVRRWQMNHQKVLKIFGFRLKYNNSVPFKKRS